MAAREIKKEKRRTWKKRIHSRKKLSAKLKKIKKKNTGKNFFFDVINSTYSNDSLINHKLQRFFPLPFSLKKFAKLFPVINFPNTDINLRTIPPSIFRRHLRYAKKKKKKLLPASKKRRRSPIV